MTRHSNDANALPLSGLQRQVQQDSRGAAVMYRRVLELDPQNKEAWYRLGLIEQQNGRTAQARADYEKALRSDPSFVSALYSEANLVVASEPGRAIELLKRAVAGNPKAGAVRLQLGRLLVKEHLDAEAKDVFRQAVAADHQVLSQVPEAFRNSMSPPPTPSHEGSTG